MFILRDKCQFKISKVVFTVPKDYYIKATYLKLDNNMLYFAPPDESFVVCYRLVCNSNNKRWDVINRKEKLLILLSLLSNQYQPSKKIEHNGLKWCCTTSRNEMKQCFEASFLIEETDSGSTEFEFLILTYNGDIERIKKSSEFKELFDGIQIFI